MKPAKTKTTHPKNPHRNPNPIAGDTSGSNLSAASFSCSLPSASLNAANPAGEEEEEPEEGPPESESEGKSPQ